MSLKTRGQQTSIRFAMGDRGVRGGSMLKVRDFDATPRTELMEDDYLGEDQSDLDIQHNGWDGKFSVDSIDAEALDVMDEIIGAEENRQAHPQITISEIINFREPGARGRMYVYHECFVKAVSEGVAGRKEKHTVPFEFKAKKRTPLNI